MADGTPEPMGALSGDDAIGRLAAFLTLNHLYASLGWEAHRARAEVLGPDAHLEALQNAEIRPRVILVLGAGASHAFSGIPLGDDLFPKVRRLVPATMDELYERNLERLVNIYRLDRNHLETKLLALSAIDREATVEAIRTVCGKRLFPSLGYEIVAHLMKHRFVDAVVNFNFDELLDQALEDEMEEGDYHRIVLDGDCPDDPESIIPTADRRFDLPLYIKPHGTAGHKTSLRYTREHYFLIPSEIHALLEVLFHDMPAAVVVAGYAMQSLEFQKALKSVHPRSEAFILDPRRPAARATQDFSLTHFIKITEDRTLADALSRLYTSSLDCFEDAYRPRHLVRHRVVTDLFTGRLPTTDRGEKAETTRTYLRDRTVVELALSIAKAKGFVNLKDLARDRVGKYYERYRRAVRKAESLYKLGRDLGMRTATYSRYAMRFGRTEHSREMIVGSDARENMIDELTESVRATLSAVPAARLAADPSGFRHALKKMYDGGEVEISPQWEQRHGYVFHRPGSIRTQTQMVWETKRLLRRPRWQALLVVAETGQWMVGGLKDEILRALDAVPGRRIGLVVADGSFRSELLETFSSSLMEEDIRRLPWWVHNQHMTLTLRDGSPHRALFFTRRLRSARISPMTLRDADARAAFSMFTAYWEMAQPDVKWLDFTPDNVRDSERRLLDHFDGEREADTD